MKYELRWVGEEKPEYLPTIHREIEELFEGGLDKPGDLITHTAFLTDDHEGPSIAMYGIDDLPNVFFVEYCAVTKWVSIRELDEAEVTDAALLRLSD